MANRSLATEQLDTFERGFDLLRRDMDDSGHGFVASGPIGRYQALYYRLRRPTLISETEKGCRTDSPRTKRGMV